MSLDKFGIYVHIPFCIQRCSYCDFATYSRDQVEANQDYVDALLFEARMRRGLFSERLLHTIYFGGGTPSLLEAQQIAQIITSLRQMDFEFAPDIEITLEVNPATLTEGKCAELKAGGVNRLSIGCQSFNDDYLKACGREHNSEDTFRTIELAQKYFENYSLDLLFALPKQNIEQLSQDLVVLRKMNPPHISAYCLTLNDKHPMNEGRCSDEEQVIMFSQVHKSFQAQGLKRYELSNFSKMGFESQHNNLYWQDCSYWGLGLSAHSYKKDVGWGQRFWNPSSYSTYMQETLQLEPSQTVESSFHQKNYEQLFLYEAMSDFCHTHLRLQKGLNKVTFSKKFHSLWNSLIEPRLKHLGKQRLVEQKGDCWRLSERGVVLSNQVFSGLLFCQDDIDKVQR